jgi:excisionase family DNA binding protein
MVVDALTVDEVANKMRVTPKTVRAWLKAGKLQGSRFGHSWLIMEETVQKALNGEDESETKQ